MMIVWLDHLIFGNGRGLAPPNTDRAYCWLNDSYGARGQFYVWSGWYGTQLTSFQWTYPKAGEQRYLAGYAFRPFSSRRRWGRVQVAWRMDGLSSDRDTAMDKIQQFKSGLQQLV